MLLIACIFYGCRTSSTNNQQFSINIPRMTGPKILIYKTRKDYNMLVPIDLSADKRTIVSFPGIKDIYKDGNLSTPTLLNEGFLFDNHGISANVAFLKLTYQQYAELPVSPNPDSLFNLVLDDDPLTVLYDCGNKNDYHDLIYELNILIKNYDFAKFKKLK